MLNTPDVSSKEYPYRSLLQVNNDVHSQLYSVVESFLDQNLKHMVKEYDRNIAQVISHTLTTERYYFIGHLAEGKSIENYDEPTIKTIKQALEMIQENLDQTNSQIENLSIEDLNTTIKTEWGQEMTKELALWQGITQIMLHTGEICLMAGIGGFYKGVLG
ncbi:DinB family protein [Candidatus Dojkabacteria bacterium]|nr:DinB family protein [Candidatus Dojkabacteria bacterium]